MADQKIESMSALIAGVAHDFNNLLGAIVARAESAQALLDPQSPAAQDVDHIHRTALQAAEMVAQIFKLSDGEESPPSPIDLSEAVSQTLDILRLCIPKVATLRVDLTEGLPSIRVDRSEIRSLAMNLVINASEALGEKPGTVTVRTAAVPSTKGPGSVALEVEDTGCGMAPEVMERIFEPLFTTRPQGRGVGLAAVKAIVDRRGGTIQVVSAPGAGSRFLVTFPSVEDLEISVTEAAAGVEAPTSVPQVRSVLMIEDEAALRDPVSRMLRRAGIQVVEASSGEDGVENLRNGGARVDAVILDLTLPGMSGLDAFREVRRLRPDVRVIITSAYGRRTIQEGLGFEESWLYLRKPYRMKELLSLIGTGQPTASARPASLTAGAG